MAGLLRSKPSFNSSSFTASCVFPIKTSVMTHWHYQSVSCTQKFWLTNGIHSQFFGCLEIPGVRSVFTLLYETRKRLTSQCRRERGLLVGIPRSAHKPAGKNHVPVFYRVFHKFRVSIARETCTNRIPRLLLSQKPSKSSRRCVGIAPSSQPRNFLSSAGTLALEKLFVKAMSLYRPAAGQWNRDQPEESNMSMVCKYLECDGSPVWYVDHTGWLCASLHRIAGHFHE